MSNKKDNYDPGNVLPNKKDFGEYYNIYIKHYNTKDENEKLSAYAELVTIRQDLQQCIDDFTDRVHSLFDRFQKLLKMETLGSEEYTEIADELIFMVEVWAKMNAYTYDSERMLNKLPKRLNELFGQCSSEDNANNLLREAMFYIDRIIGIGEYQSKATLQLNAINAVIDMIYADNYPEDLFNFEDLSPSEQEAVKSGRGRQKWKNNKEDPPENFEKELKKLMNKGILDQRGMADKLIDKFNIPRKTDTVCNWIRDTDTWQNRKKN